MDFQSEKKIFDIHSAFLLEYSQATGSLSEFYQTVISYFAHIITQTKEQPSDSLEENIRSVQEICFFLKTFCSEIELHTQLLKLKTKPDATNLDVSEGVKEDVTDDEIVEQLKNDDFEYKLPENPNEIFPYEVYPELFTFTTIDPNEFKVGFEDEFFISYIKDTATFSFFMMKASCSDIIINQPEFRYDMIPSKGTVFGIMLDGVIFRAVRENSLKHQPNSFKVFLIDFGEIIEITKEYKMYRLTEEMQQFPGQSIFCKLSADDYEYFDDENFLRDKLYSKQSFRIDRVYRNMLEVTFLPPSIPPKPIIVTSQTATSSSSFAKPTLTLRDSNLQNLSNGTETIPKNHKITTPNSIENKRCESLTQEELDELYEEPLNTENALEAVMGYIPQDDKRICKHFDPKTNACFKGSNCKLEHTTILKDGWTKDQQTFKLKIHAQTVMPKVGKKINLFVQYVDDVDRFYGQIIPKNCKQTDDLPAEHIFKKINTPEMMIKFKKFLKPPAEFELVFAMFQGEWYRAKILQKLSDIQYRVFYVDYGNCSVIKINEMRRWEDEFDCYPFQAIECKLDNIIKFKNRDAKAIAFFENLVFQKSVIATVTSNVGILLVTLRTQEFDVGEQLCAAQFAGLKTITAFGDKTFPG